MPGSLLIKRGDLFRVHLSGTKGSEQSGRRPVCVIQNDVGNALAPTVIVAPLSSKHLEKEYPTNVFVPKDSAGLSSDSVVLLSQIRSIDKGRLNKKIGSLPENLMVKVDQAIRVSLALLP